MIDGAELWDEKPDHYSDDQWEAYKRGWYSAMALISSAAEQSAMGVKDTMGDEDAEEEEAPECEDCGSEMRKGLGDEYVCLEC